MPKIKIDDVEYDTDTMTDKARSTLLSVRFVDEVLQKKGHELNIAKTAQSAYAAAMKRGEAKTGATSNTSTQGDD
jgi:fido (protein-threonine AMPylation protein)